MIADVIAGLTDDALALSIQALEAVLERHQALLPAVVLISSLIGNLKDEQERRLAVR